MSRNHVAWFALGVLAVAGLWYAYSVPGAIAMFAAIGLAFIMWYKLGSRGSWITLIVVGVSMSSILGWQAVTGSRCPAPGTKVFLKVGKPPISCDDVRASASVMSLFFALIAVIGIAAPFYARVDRDSDGDDELDGAAPIG